MTVPVPGSLTYTHVEDGVSTVFSYPVRFLEAAELTVIREAADGQRSTLVYNTDYTVSGAGNPSGGSITRTAVTNGGKIIITRSTSPKQLVDLQDGQRNPAEAVELQMDRLAMVGQDHGRDIARSMKVRVDASPLPEGHFPIADGDGDMVDGGSAADIADAGQNAADAKAAADRAEAAAAGLNLPAIISGDAGKVLRVDSASGGYKLIQLEADIRDAAAIDGTGTNDDSSDVNTLLSQAATAGVGLYVPLNFLVGLGNKIVIPDGGKFVGGGGGQYPSTVGQASGSSWLATPKTRFAALDGFPPDTPMIEVKTPDGTDWSYQDILISGICLDCAGNAQRGLDWVGIKHSHVEDMTVMRPTFMGINEDVTWGAVSGTAVSGTTSTLKLQQSLSSFRNGWHVGSTITLTSGAASGDARTITAYDGATQTVTVNPDFSASPGTPTYSIARNAALLGAGGTQFNTWKRTTVWAGNTGSAIGWRLTGDPIGDISNNTRELVRVVCNAGDAIQIQNADNDLWNMVHAYNYGAGAGIRFMGNNVNVIECGRDNEMKAVQTSGPGTLGLVFDSGSVGTARGNVIELNVGNNPPLWTDTPKANRIYPTKVTNGHGWVDFSSACAVTFATPGDLSVSYAVKVARGALEGRTYRFVISLTFTPTFSTASGTFTITGLPYLSRSVPGLLGWSIPVNAITALPTWGTSRTNLVGRVAPNSSVITLYGSASGTANAAIATTQFTSGSAATIGLSGEYEVQI